VKRSVDGGALEFEKASDDVLAGVVDDDVIAAGMSADVIAGSVDDVIAGDCWASADVISGDDLFIGGGFLSRLQCSSHCKHCDANLSHAAQ